MLPQTQDSMPCIARHAEIEAELSGQIAAGRLREAVARIVGSRPGGRSDQDLSRGRRPNSPDVEALIDDPRTDLGDARDRRGRAARACSERIEALEKQIQLALLPKDAMDERNVDPRNPRRHRRRRSLAVRRRPVPHVRALRRQAGLEGRDRCRSSEGAEGGFKEIIAEMHGRGVVRQAEIRVRRAPRAARARHRSLRPHPYLGGHRRGAAGGRRCRHRDQGRRSEDRHHARAGRRRPARQQDRVGDPHHAYADRHRGRSCRRSARSTRTRPRRWRCCAPSFTTREREQARCRARRRPQGPDRLGRPLRAHPHL